MKEELLRIAVMVEGLKNECGTDPESPQAIRNGEYQSIAIIIRDLADKQPEQLREPALRRINQWQW